MWIWISETLTEFILSFKFWLIFYLRGVAQYVRGNCAHYAANAAYGPVKARLVIIV